MIASITKRMMFQLLCSVQNSSELQGQSSQSLGCGAYIGQRASQLDWANPQLQ